MQITKDQLIAGQPALKVRSFVRAYRILSFYTSEFEKVLNLCATEAEDFAREMVNLGFLTQTRIVRSTTGLYTRSATRVTCWQMPPQLNLLPERQRIVFSRSSWNACE